MTDNNMVYYGAFTFNKTKKTIVDHRIKLENAAKFFIPETIDGVTVEQIRPYAVRKQGLLY